MPDDFLEHIVPIMGSTRIDRLEGQGGASPPGRAARSISGRVVSVRRGLQNRGGEHTLDVSVGGEDFTEIVLRVPSGPYANLEGRSVVIFIEE